MMMRPDFATCSWVETRDWLHRRVMEDPRSKQPIRRRYEDEPTERPIVVNIETSGPSWNEINSIEQRLLHALAELRKQREQVEGLTKAIGRFSVARQQNKTTRSDSDKGAIY